MTLLRFLLASLNKIQRAHSSSGLARLQTSKTSIPITDGAQPKIFSFHYIEGLQKADPKSRNPPRAFLPLPLSLTGPINHLRTELPLVGTSVRWPVPYCILCLRISVVASSVTVDATMRPLLSTRLGTRSSTRRIDIPLRGGRYAGESSSRITRRLSSSIAVGEFFRRDRRLQSSASESGTSLVLGVILENQCIANIEPIYNVEIKYKAKLMIK